MPASQTLTDEQTDIAARKRRMMFYAAAAGVFLALLFSYVLPNIPGIPFFNNGSTKPESQQGQETILFNKSAQQIAGPSPPEHVYTEQELLALATEAKNAGLVVQGVTQCGYTRKQRELFGGPNSEARKVFESIYIECRSRDMCPNVRGYPTWTRGEQMFPGYRNVERIRELIKEVGPLPAQQAPRDASEPNEENIPDAKAAVPSAPLPQDVKAQDNVNVAETRIVAATNQEEDDEDEPEDKKTENVRGVSQYAPLNVPDMPGTAPMTTGGLSQPDYQFLQGNLPRQALDNPEPVMALAKQMAFTFQQIAHDAARDPGASAYAEARMPQSANITTGFPMHDNRIYTEKNG